jgi:nucleotide-binding universal stress UspA family protein
MQQERQSNETESSHSILPRKFSFKRIVVGFEYGGCGQTALGAAVAIAKEFQSELFIVHSVPPTSVTLGVVGEPPEAIDEHLEGIRSSIEEAIKAAGVTSRSKVIVGLDSPSILIEQIARQQDADLIIVGTRGRHGVEQLLSGSVSQSIAGHVNCPVLILGPEFDPTENLLKTILFASDLNETGVRAAQYAGNLASDHYCRLVLLHVLPKKPRAEGRMREWVEENVSDKLYKLLDADARSECDHEAMIAYGEPEQEILAAADSKHADLVIIGGKDHLSMSDHASWRTLTKLAQHLRCPILRVGANSK